MSTVAIPPAFRQLVDDAAIFPPGLSPLPVAVRAHAEHLRSPHRDFVGPFIVGADAVDQLADLVTVDDYPTGLRISVVVPATTSVAQVVDDVSGLELVRLVAVEVKLDPSRSPASHIGTVATQTPPHVTAYVEAPRPAEPTWPQVLDAVAAHRLTLKLRTGGTEEAAFPTDLEVATWIRDAVAADLPFKCTAGLHNALRHTSPETGFEHHGYLNLLTATWLASTGGDLPDIEDVVAERDSARLASAVALNPGIAGARRWFTSYGSCSVMEPLHDLEALGLLTRTDHEGLS